MGSSQINMRVSFGADALSNIFQGIGERLFYFVSVQVHADSPIIGYSPLGC